MKNVTRTGAHTIRAAVSALLFSMLLTGVMGTVLADDNNNNNEVRLKTRLSGAAIGGKVPEGSAEFRSEAAKNRSRIQVEVENVNLPAGTILTVAINGVTLTKTITLSATGFGELELDTQDGDVVPTVTTGSTITVMNGAKAILAGVF